MNKNETTTQPEFPTCGEPMETHIMALLSGMAMTGLGAGCIDTYKALVEVMEYVKVHHDYPDYTPTNLVARLVQEDEMLQAAGAQEFVKA